MCIDLEERSEEMEQMDKFLDDNSIHDETIQNDNNENIEYKTCRICYDGKYYYTQCTVTY